MEPTHQVIISQTARTSLRAIVAYIRQDSPQAAQNVRKELIALAESLSASPERFPPEPYLAHKPGEYRSAKKWHYKLIYRITEKQVRVLDIVHTRQHPSRIEALE